MFRRLLAKVVKDDHFKDLLTGSSTVMLFRVLAMGAGYIFNFVLARGTNAEITGVYATCATIVTLVVTFGKLGLGTSTVKFVAGAAAKEDKATIEKVYVLGMRVLTVSLISLAAVVYLLRNQLADWYSTPLLPEALLFAALVIPFRGWLAFNSEVFRGLKKMASFSLFQPGTVKILEALILVIAFYFGFKEPETAVQVLMISTAVALIISYFVRRRILSITNPSASSFSLKEMFAVSLPMMVSASTYVIMTLLDVLVLGLYQPQAEVGIYNIAFKISSLITVPLFAINSMAAPKFSHFKGLNDKKNLIKVARQSAKLNFLASAPIFLGVIVLSSWLMALFGEEFVAGAILLNILAIGQFYNTSCGSVLNLLNMAGQEKIVRNIVIFTTLVNLGLNILLAKEYGAVGVSWATTASLILWNTLGLFAVKKHYGFWMIPNPFKAAG